MNRLKKIDELEMSFHGAAVLLPLIGLGSVVVEIVLFTLTAVYHIRTGDVEPFRLALLIALWGAIIFVAVNTKRTPSHPVNEQELIDDNQVTETNQ